MTDRLYYDDAYLRAWDARVLEARGNDARLDRSAFYPTSGGQPYDTGTLGDARVQDVRIEDGEVWHALDRPVEVGARVRCEIDWPRRFDHMQQHGGEHLLAGEVWRLLRGVTIGLHLGQSDSTIDVELPGGATRVSEGELHALEDAVNARVQSDAPCRCWFPDAAELAALPLRKPPTVSEHVRVVAFGDFEMVACGGTHPSSTGQIGLVKLLDARPARGKMRLTFVCGMRALRDYQARMNASERAAAALSAPFSSLPDAVARLQEENLRLKHSLNDARRERLLDRVPSLLAGATALPDGARLVCAELEETEPDTLRELAGALTGTGNAVALLSAPSEKGLTLLFARSADAAGDMGALMRACGGKGGGKPDFAQGMGARDTIGRARAALFDGI